MTPAIYRQLRKELKLLQSDVASMLGVTVTTVQNWEAGRTPVPITVRAIMIRMISEKAGTPVSAFACLGWAHSRSQP